MHPGYRVSGGVQLTR